MAEGDGQIVITKNGNKNKQQKFWRKRIKRDAKSLDKPKSDPDPMIIEIKSDDDNHCKKATSNSAEGKTGDALSVRTEEIDLTLDRDDSDATLRQDTKLSGVAEGKTRKAASVSKQKGKRRLTFADVDSQIEPEILRAKVRETCPYECGNDLAAFLESNRHLLDKRPNGRVTKLHIFDFDGTLFRSPIPNRRMWTDESLLTMIKGEFNWFQDPRTLRPPYVPLEPQLSWFIDHVLGAASAANKAQRDPEERKNHIVMLLTGRLRANFRDRILEILRSTELTFDVICCKEPPAPRFRERTYYDESQTFGFKMSFVSSVLHFVRSIDEVEVWDDRKQQCALFSEELGALRNMQRIKKFQVHKIEESDADLRKCPNPALIGLESHDNASNEDQVFKEKLEQLANNDSKNESTIAASTFNPVGPVGWLTPTAELELVRNLIDLHNAKRQPAQSAKRSQNAGPLITLVANPLSVGIHVCAADRRELLRKFPIPPWVSVRSKWIQRGDYIALFEGSMTDETRPFVCKPGKIPLCVTHVGMVSDRAVAARLYCAINCRGSGAPADLRILLSHAPFEREPEKLIEKITEWCLLDTPITIAGIVAQHNHYEMQKQRSKRSINTT